MPHHRFKLGQIVNYLPDKLQTAARAGEYKITRLLPVVAGVFQYRIRNNAEAFERAAHESQLTVQGDELALIIK